jgi:diguanylate cyclase (GGDEF)-like protein
MFAMCHGLAISLIADHAKPISFAFLVAAPLIAAGACLARWRREASANGWIELALAMLLWSGGMAVTMYVDVIVADPDATPGLGMLLYVLYGVPLIFAVASPRDDPAYVRAVDGVLALALGYLFFVHTFTFATASAASETGVFDLRLMFDIENIFIALFALTRYLASHEPRARFFFGALTIFAFVYLAAAAYINHVEMESDYGGMVDLVIGAPFLVMAVMALRLCPAEAGLSRPAAFPVSARFVLAVRAGSPLMLPVTLLVVSALIAPSHLALAIAGFATASLGYGLRNILVQMRGIAERDKLAELTFVDGLTGLANRRQFDQALSREWNRARRHGSGLAVLMIDIDHFKRLNDAFGHPVGDDRLREVGQTLAGCVKRATDMIARYGGEEFAAVLPATGPDDAVRLGETMRAAVARLKLPSPAAPGIVTVSIGVGYGDAALGDDPAALLAIADSALYEAKQGGRDRVALRYAAAGAGRRAGG